VDPVNRENTFISYYAYGSMLGLALDLSLRQQGLTLDGYMKLLWDAHGRNEHPYTITDLHISLNQYAGKAFGDDYFNNYIYNSGMPDYEFLFREVGIVLSRDPEAPWLGISTTTGEDGKLVIQNNTPKGSPAYMAGLVKGDILLSLNGVPLPDGVSLNESLPGLRQGDSLQVQYGRRGEERSAILVAAANPSYTINLSESTGATASEKKLKAREAWLGQ
jgi:predicted metalloprotease with PDZ domain